MTWADTGWHGVSRLGTLGSGGCEVRVDRSGGRGTGVGLVSWAHQGRSGGCEVGVDRSGGRWASMGLVGRTNEWLVGWARLARSRWSG
jgi:hypothetical protein